MFFQICICVRYLGRTILFSLKIMVLHISFFSDILEEPYYFALIICFSIFPICFRNLRRTLLLCLNCLRYLERITLLRFNNMFFHISLVPGTREDPRYFALLIFLIFHLSQIPGKNHITSLQKYIFLYCNAIKFFQISFKGHHCFFLLLYFIILSINHSSFSRSFGKDLIFRVG